MEIANLENLDVMTEADFRAANGHLLFPPELDNDLLAELGYAVVEYDPEPALAPGERLEPGDLLIEHGRAIRGWAVIPAPPVDWPAVIADRRWKAEVGGIDVGGIHVDTDDRSKLLINGAAVEAMLDPEYVMSWKTPGGFVELTAAEVITVARAVRAHVQACFNREAELLTALDGQTLTPAMLEEGWPGMV